MKVWRKLIKAGAVQLKGSVYILPDTEEHYEFLQWLVTEISGMEGEGAFARIDKIETMKNPEIIALFNEQRGSDYRDIGKSLDDLERRLGSIQKGARVQNIKVISEQFDKLVREYDGIAAVDFFHASEGKRLTERIDNVKSQIKVLVWRRDKKREPDSNQGHFEISGKGMGHKKETLHRPYGLRLAHQEIHRPQGCIRFH